MPHTKICEQCYTQFTTSDQRQKFCNRSCYTKNKANPSRYKPCEVCKEPFYLNYPNRRFCSKECRLKAGWTDHNPNKWTTFTCEWCNKEFENWISRPNRFCSNQCRSKFAAIQPKPNAQKPEIHIELNCQYCRKPYKTTIHQVRLRNSRFCSRECSYAMRSIEMRGENNHNWTGGTLDPDAYGPNWHRQARRAKKRDNHTCQTCDYKSGGNKILDVHHIIPIKEFNGDWETANRLSNLISLCRSCHVKVEKGKIPCPMVN